MALAFLWKKQHLWPFSVLESDDLRVSYELVQKLPIPEDTKRYVYAVREPETESVIYILCVQNYSEWSAWDAEVLIREIKPDAVIVKNDVSYLKELKLQERMLSHLSIENPVPVSSFEVVKRCFKEELRVERYNKLAQKCVLREILGVDCGGHWFAANRAAQDVGLSRLLLGAPLFLSHLSATSAIHDQAVHVFPSFGTALAHVRKIFDHVNRGEAVDALAVSKVYPFRSMIELLRSFKNDQGRLPISRMNTILSRIEFSELALEDKIHALSAQSLRSLTKRFKTIVAVVDAGDLKGLRIHWYTHIPQEYKDLAVHMVTRYEGEAARPVARGSSFSELVKASIIMNAKAKLRIPTTSDFVIRAAENTSWWAVRTAFYEMMRNGKVQLHPLSRLVTFGRIRMVLLWDKVGIKCAADSLPAAPSIARLGRGIRSLSHAAQVVKYTHESLGYHPTRIAKLDALR
ncbi:hypothetical protein ACLB2K_071303 [Fragaria x ananassa]